MSEDGLHPAAGCQDTGSHDAALELAGERVLLVGRLSGMNRRDAQQAIRAAGATLADRVSDDVSLVVVGEEQGLPLDERGQLADLFDAETREAIEQGAVRIIGESQLWQRLGIVESQRHVQRLYTPAMLAELLRVPLAVVRRWHRRGLIRPVREVHKLPYFDFQEVASARALAQLLAAGVSPTAIEKKLQGIRRFLPGIDRPLAQLSVIVEGKQLLMRQGGGLLDPGGQLRFDFDAEAADHDHETDPQTTTNSLAESIDRATDASSHLALEGDSATGTPYEIAQFGATQFGTTQFGTAPFSSTHVIGPEPLTFVEAVVSAERLEDEGDLENAAALYREALRAGGPDSEICFRLAELLYRMGEPSAARERYEMAIELDQGFIEARSNLGCVLAELNQTDASIAAFETALIQYPDYPDAHYHLARLLDELERQDEAQDHWRAFLVLAPESPWAEEAREQLSLKSTT